MATRLRVLDVWFTHVYCYFPWCSNFLLNGVETCDIYFQKANHYRPWFHWCLLQTTVVMQSQQWITVPVWIMFLLLLGKLLQCGIIGWHGNWLFLGKKKSTQCFSKFLNYFFSFLLEMYETSTGSGCFPDFFYFWSL